MPDIEPLLTRWQSSGVLDAAIADRIRTWESEQQHPAGIRWQGIVALILGAFLLASGVVLFVSAHWDEFGPGARLTIILTMVALFHLAGAYTRASFHGLSTTLHAVGTVSTGAAIALIGQIFNIQEHWPAAILLWALAAVAGWALLQDEAQQILTLLLIPAWLLSELAYDSQNHIGQGVYMGRFLFAWSVLYLTLFLGSKRKAVQGILFAVAAIAAVTGVVYMLESWTSWGNHSSVSLPFRFWAWTLVAVLPLIAALFRFRKSFAPVLAAVVVCAILPWCTHNWPMYYTDLKGHAVPTLKAGPISSPTPWSRPSQSSSSGGASARPAKPSSTLASWALLSRSSGSTSATSSIKFGRSLGLIGLGILFLAGGWALERMRRRLISQMSPQPQHRGRAMNLAKASLALLVIQLALISSIAAKYLYQRSTCPRVWTRASMVRPFADHARSLPQHAAHGRRMPKHSAVRQASWIPTQPRRRAQRNQLRHHAPQPVVFPARLTVNENKLVAIRIPENDDSAAGESVVAASGAPCNQMRLSEAVNFYLAEHATSPLPVKTGQELWVEVTVPPQGPPRPIQLALKDNGAWKPLAFQ